MLLTMAEFVGAAEIGEMLGGVSRQRVYQIVSRATFPAPYQTMRAGRIWKTVDVEKWIQQYRTTLDAE